MKNLFPLLALLTFSGSLTAADSEYTPEITLVPREGKGIGTLSTYGGVTPVFGQDTNGEEVINLPESDKNEVNLVWTFWQHTRPSPTAWPAGNTARVAFTLSASHPAQVRIQASFKAEKLEAGREAVVDVGTDPVTVLVPMPTEAPESEVEHIRLRFIGNTGSVPTLTIGKWSLGQEDEPDGTTTTKPSSKQSAAPAPKSAKLSQAVPDTKSSARPEHTDEPALQPGDGIYQVKYQVVPKGADGVYSNYGGVVPTVEGDVVRLPAKGASETNLIWTFYSHLKPSLQEWPQGPNSRATLTLSSPSDVTIRPGLAVQAETWTDQITGDSLSLKAGQAATIELDLPLPSSGPIQAVRLFLKADEKLPDLAITEFSLGRSVIAEIKPADKRQARTDTQVPVSGRVAKAGPVLVQALNREGTVIKDWQTKADPQGNFNFIVDREELKPGLVNLRATSQSSGTPVFWSQTVPHYVYPILKEGASLDPVTQVGRNLIVNGRPWAFVGLNYTRFSLEFSRKTNFEVVAEEMRRYSDWGITVLRVPLHLGMFQPRPGVFPDSPEYEDILKSHKTDPEFFALFEYALAVAGHYGIRLVLDWHELPDDPYRYFVGGDNHAKKSGGPSNGIAWLYNWDTKSAPKRGSKEVTKAIVDTNRWLARRLKGNGNVLGFEVPYNEPHDILDSGDMDWRKLTAETILPIITEDPTRLTFAMPPAYGHNNVQPTGTWLPPDHVSGLAPHHYHANGPVKFRPDAKEHKEPWLARDVNDTFSYAFYATALPYSAVPVPVWNGESGEHGFASFRPGVEQREASAPTIEAQIVQTYAMGWSGAVGWTLTGNKSAYLPILDIYEKNYRRFAPVYAAGPVDMSQADILIVQNPGAEPVNNALNYACIPFAKLALDLHLAPVHYMTDDQLLANGLIQIATGLEQVEQGAGHLKYKAAIVDTRNLDQRALEVLKRMKVPLLETAHAGQLSKAEVAAFLKNAGLYVDERTPSDLQLIQGPGHFLIYRRSGEGEAHAYPMLRIEGKFELIDELGNTAFSGTREVLAEQGIRIELEPWSTAIYEIRRQ